MEFQYQRKQIMLMTIMFAVGVAAIVGALVGYAIWGLDAGNFSVMSKSNEATRTVTIDHVSVTFPSVIVCASGEASTRDVAINNLDEAPRHITVSLNLVRNSGVDSTTISELTRSSFEVSLAAYGTMTEVVSLKPSSEGYAIFDVRMNGELLGSIALYVVT